jgi:hypothetical protein
MKRSRMNVHKVYVTETETVSSDVNVRKPVNNTGSLSAIFFIVNSPNYGNRDRVFGYDVGVEDGQKLTYGFRNAHAQRVTNATFK